MRISYYLCFLDMSRSAASLCVIHVEVADYGPESSPLICFSAAVSLSEFGEFSLFLLEEVFVEVIYRCDYSIIDLKAFR
jgi:hypothetical protein